MPGIATGGGIFILGVDKRQEEEDFRFLKQGRYCHDSRNVVTGDTVETLFETTVLSSFSACL